LTYIDFVDPYRHSLQEIWGTPIEEILDLGFWIADLLYRFALSFLLN
jgi:hypothetical protein